MARLSSTSLGMGLPMVLLESMASISQGNRGTRVIRSCCAFTVAGKSEALVDVFSHSFVELTWEHGGRHHVNPSFSRDGMRLYYNKAVNRNTSYAYSYDLTGLVSQLERAARPAYLVQ